MYAGILKVGRSSEYKAYMKSTLMSWIESLPPWYFAADDNAYVCTEHLLTPFMGSDHFNPVNDSYNFFLSQLRVVDSSHCTRSPIIIIWFGFPSMLPPSQLLHQ